MVDKVETPVEAIKKEAEILQSMDHPNIVKFHGVYYERCFVCIVMDKLDGGDLVEGLQRHLKERGQINCLDVVHVAYQMAASIHYLHQRNYMHRDVKGDNYLMDRKNMTDKQCKIVLTDFGTACTATPSDRLSSGVGTKIFWSPEFFDRDYGHKVDVWAMGVIMYGLVSGRFPFRDENDVRPPDGADKPAEEPGTQQELIQRMNREAESRKGNVTKRQLQNHKHKKFVVADKIVQGGKASYEWWSEDQALWHWHLPAMLSLRKKDKLLDFENLAAAPKDDPMDLAMFRKTLVEHNIDPNQFGVGKAKGIEQLAKEVETGASRLMLDAQQHKKLVRVVDIVVLKLRPDDGSRLLVEFKEQFPDGRERETLRLPGTKKEPHENARQTSERILREMMNMDPSMVTFDFSTVERQEEETDSPSFPGVTTVYRKELVECKVTTPDKALVMLFSAQAAPRAPRSAPKGNTKFFTWLTDSEAENKKVKLKVHGSQISTLVRAPIGLDEEALREYLVSHSIDISKFGHDGTKSLKEFSSELIKGETRLLQVSSGEILVITEVVMLILHNPETKETLVQTAQMWPDGKTSYQARIPGAKRRPDENQFLCARRILKRQLEIDENAVRISKDVGYIEEDRSSRGYPGLKTVYRKRVIKGEVIPSEDPQHLGPYSLTIVLYNSCAPVSGNSTRK
ncbi:unnamed protein product [Durusdinium trenchii]|uniref:Protein kinase domain-containing protein n=1 Tax=Durusdinium trenchii TaxID=1381693 RepID=A0ABP0IME3_9DINO